ncbi:hypothetical protein [Nocardia jiangxiensis]|uniref:hypothetical protein n=1 Tax=Nocardia jiangxiensis TaxID=282685 RepID=UPI0002F8908A|nr:hypothetical protein [Nocardia jiangxiensis]
MITIREGVKLTAKQRELIGAINVELEAGHWEPIPAPGYTTIRWMRDVPTPESFRGEGFGRWPDETYFQVVFLSIVTGKPWSLHLGVVSAPWVGRRDSTITMTRAMEILRDPQRAL